MLACMLVTWQKREHTHETTDAHFVSDEKRDKVRSSVFYAAKGRRATEGPSKYLNGLRRFRGSCAQPAWSGVHVCARCWPAAAAIAALARVLDLLAVSLRSKTTHGGRWTCFVF